MQTQERLTRTQDRQNHTTRVSYLVKAMRSILAGQWRGRAKRTRLFVFHVLKRVYSTSTLYLLLADEPGGTERKGMRGGRSFPSFPVIVFPDRSREVTHVRKGSLGIQNPEAAGTAITTCAWTVRTSGRAYCTRPLCSRRRSLVPTDFAHETQARRQNKGF